MRKAIISLFWLIGFIILFSTCSQAKFVSVATNDAFLMSKPQLSSLEEIGCPRYYPLYVLDKSNGWYMVRDWMGTKGWIPEEQVSSEATLIVRSMKANVRSGPGPNYRQIATFLKGYTLKVEKRYGYWYKVELVDPPEGTVGWIYRSLVWGE